MPDAPLQDRVALLETRLGRLRLFAQVAFLLAAASMAWGVSRYQPATTGPAVWEARDAGGRLRAVLGLAGDGVGLTMYDSMGQMRLDLGLSPSGVPGLLLVSPRGEPVATLNLAEDGSPLLRMVHPSKRSRMVLRPAADSTWVMRGPPVPPDTLLARRPRDRK